VGSVPLPSACIITTARELFAGVNAVAAVLSAATPPPVVSLYDLSSDGAESGTAGYSGGV